MTIFKQPTDCLIDRKDADRNDAGPQPRVMPQAGMPGIRLWSVNCGKVPRVSGEELNM